MAQAHTRSALSDPQCDTPRAGIRQAAKGAQGAQGSRASVRRQRHRCGGKTTADGALGSWGQLEVASVKQVAVPRPWKAGNSHHVTSTSAVVSTRRQHHPRRLPRLVVVLQGISVPIVPHQLVLVLILVHCIQAVTARRRQRRDVVTRTDAWGIQTVTVESEFAVLASLEGLPTQPGQSATERTSEVERARQPPPKMNACSAQAIVRSCIPKRERCDAHVSTCKSTAYTRAHHDSKLALCWLSTPTKVLNEPELTLLLSSHRPPQLQRPRQHWPPWPRRQRRQRPGRQPLRSRRSFL